MRPRPTRASSVGAFGLTLACGLVLDQITKAWANDALAHATMQVIPGFLTLTLVHNQGAAFGVGQGHATLFVILACAIIVACGAYVVVGRHHTRLEVVSLGLACAGAAGNALDRVMTGAVTDMLSLAFVDFPVFNVADIAITCGFALFVLSVFTNPDEDGPASGAVKDRSSR